jgi:hypothetical protein
MLGKTRAELGCVPCARSSTQLWPGAVGVCGCGRADMTCLQAAAEWCVYQRDKQGAMRHAAYTCVSASVLGLLHSAQLSSLSCEKRNRPALCFLLPFLKGCHC